MPTYIRTRSEFAVNSHTAGGQGSSTVATFADGGFIVTWATTDPAQDGDGSAIKAQLFDSAGRKVGSEFLVNADAAGSQFQPKVATLADGKFVVTWLTQIGGDVPNSIRTQLFDRNGTPIGDEVQVNATGTSLFEPNVTALADGRYLVSWDDWSGGVRAQIFDSTGARVGGIVTLATVYASGYGDVIALANGGFVATWRDSWDIYAQIFSPSGAKVGSPFLAHTNTTGYQNEPTAVALAGGGFVLTWTDSGNGPGSVRAQMFSATGQKVGGELVVNSQSGDWISSPVVTALPDGGFFVAWHIGMLLSGGGSNTDVKGQRFSAAGVKVDGEMMINANTAGSQSMPDLATLADGRIIAVWSSDVGDRESGAIRAQILGTELAAPLPNTAPTIISDASPVHDEGLTAVTRIVASDDGEPNDLRYSITGGVDAAFFTINALTGALSFVSKPDHETPLDSNGDNHYEVIVSASDGTLSGSQTLSVYVRDANQVTIVSDGGDYNAYFQGGENHSAVTVVSAVDAEGMPLTYSISGGDDAALFTIDAQTGALSFITAPDFELPQDRYGDNYYQVVVTASDGTFSDTQRIDVQIEDVLEDGQVVIMSDGGGEQAELWVEENSAIATVVSATGSGEVVYEIVGGYDASRFTIDSVTGILAFVDAPDYEDLRGDAPWYGYNPKDWDYQLEVIVRASDGASFDEQSLVFNITDVDEAPEFYSYGGERHVDLPMYEGELEAADVVAFDPDQSYYATAPTFEIQGADAALFELHLRQGDPEFGTLRFIAAPDYESPADADGDNVYEVTVIAHSGGLSASQSYSIWIQDIDDAVSIGSDGGGDQASLWMPEHFTAVTVVAASGGTGAITYSIVGGADASAFVIDAASGALAFAVSPDYEALADADGDNVYDVVVRASDSGSFDDQSLSVHVSDLDDAPYYPDYPGDGGTVSLSMTENWTHVADIFAIDPDVSSGPITYSIMGGADADLFAIDPVTGALGLISAADFETPSDSDGDNVYEVEVGATSGSWTRIQAFSVTVENEYEGVAITSGATASVTENGGAVTTVTAFGDGDPVSFAISGGADSALFAIDSATGALSFVGAPDFEAPADSDGDNVYEVEVSAGDGRSADSKSISVTVTNQIEPVAAGGEFVVNSTYARTQAQADVTRLADGNFVVTWIDANFNSSAGRFLRAQIFGPDGYKLGGELTLSSGYDIGTQPAVAALPNGGFVVTSRPIGGIVVQMFDSAGNATSERITVSNAFGGVGVPQIAVLANGGFAITWEDERSTGADTSGSGVHLRVYDSAGVPVGGDVLVNTTTLDGQGDPSIAALAGGGYVVTWTDHNRPWTAKAQIFDSTGARVGGEFSLGDAASSGVVETSVVTLSNGNFAVAWTQGTDSGPAHRIQIFAPDGSKVGDQIVAPSEAFLLQVGPSITALSDGGFALAWSPNSAPYSDGSGNAVYVQAYDAAGRPVGAPMQVNGQSNGDQFDPSIAGLGDGRFVVTWTDLNGAGADDDQVMARIFVPEGYASNLRPAISSNGGTASASLQIDERQTAVTTVLASDSDGPSPVTYSIAGGAHAGLFTIDAATGALRFIAAPDYETPAAGSNNVYTVTVQASDGDLAAFQNLSITIADVNENVAITSNGGGEAATLSVAENGKAVTVVAAATGLGAVTYSIVGGADAADFTIDSSTGALAFASAPNFEWTADSDHDNVFEVIVRASNGLNSDEQAISVSLTNVDETPDFFDHETGVIATWAAESRAYVGVYQAYDIDGGPEITHSVTGGADGALFVIDPLTGELSFAAAGGPDFEAPADADGDNVYEVEITASQGSWSRARTFMVEVVNENEAPVITSNGGGTGTLVELNEGERNVTIVAANDPDGTPVTYSIIGGADASRFTIDATSGVLSLIDAPDYEAANLYSVIVSASDGQLSAWQGISVTIANVNEGVTITTGPNLSVNEDSAFVTRVAATDADGDPVGYAIVGGADASHFVIDPETGDLTIRASLDYEAPADADGDNVYEVVVRASDGALSDDRQVSITVNDVFDDIEILSYGGAASVALTMQESSSFQVADVDASYSAFSGARFSIGGGADSSLFTIDPNDGRLSFNYPFMPDFEAPGDADGDNVYDVVVVATMGTSTDSQAFAITITNRNEGLWITSNGGGDANLTMDEGQRTVTTVAAYDMDGDVPAYSIVGGADSALFAIDSATGALTFIAAPDYEAPHNGSGTNFYTVEVGASDGELTATQRIRIQIGNVNEAAVITSGGGGATAAVTAYENGLAVTSLAASDPDGNPLTYSIVGGADASRFTIESWSGILRFVQAPDFEAPGDVGGDNVYDVVVAVSDGALTDSQAVAVTVANLAEIVTITSNGGGANASVAVAENGTAVATVTASNPDGGAVTYAIAGGADAARFTINASTGALAFLAAPNYEAPADAGANNLYDVVVSASNGVTVDTQALAVAVGNVDEQMSITSNGGASAAVSVNENSTLVTNVVGSDPDGGAVTYVILHGGDSGLFTIDAATGVLAFRAAPDFEAPADSGGDNVYDLVVMASDGLWSDTQAIAVTVGNVNDAPIITSGGGGASGAVSVAENGLAVTVVAATDADGGSATYSIVGGADAARFTINAQTGALQFVVAPDWELPADSNQDNVYAVIVRASDGQLFDEQALSVTVTNTRDGNNVTGTAGGDSISATSTNLALRTSNEEDLVFGRDGHDTIHGMAGDDELYGEAGNDVLVGGAGADKLLGGLGKDQFTYNAPSESTAASRDTILDFSRAQGDKISLSAIDANSLVTSNQAFTFIGTSAFSNTAGQLRYETSGGTTTIWGDVNGDGVADLQIQLSGSIALVSSDFIL